MGPPRSNKRLGELLIERGCLTPGQLELALAQQRSTKEFLGEILVRQSVIDPQILLEALSEQSGIPYERLAIESVDWNVVKEFPASALSEGRCFPIRVDGGMITIAIANPLDAGALSAFERAAGFRGVGVQPVLVLASSLQQVLMAYRQRALRAIEEQLSDHDND